MKRQTLFFVVVLHIESLSQSSFKGIDFDISQSQTETYCFV